MFYRAQLRLNRLWLNFRSKEILDTPPLVTRPGALTIVTMLCHDDLITYLLALKSLYREIGEGQVCVLSDGSLTASDHGILKWHAPGVVVRDFASVDLGRCPRGGCWERLAMIVGMARDQYVIQLDADTVTLGALPEVVDAYRNNRAFTLGTKMGQSVVTPAEIDRMLAGSPGNHIQIVAERQLKNLPGAAALRYVRGSAGFAGFAQNTGSLEALEQFSGHMQRLVGDRWSEWGSEQMTSNYMIANSPAALVLPYPRYACYQGETDLRQNVFLHFVGSHRHKNGAYISAARAAIQALAPSETRQ